MSSPMKLADASEERGAESPLPTSNDDLSQPSLQKAKLITLPVVASGAGLFSDGYINCVIGSVSTILGHQYGTEWLESQQLKVVGAIAFAGCVVGMLGFGYLSDRWSRMHSLLVSTVLLFVFTILAAASYYKGETMGMFTMLAVWRFFVGIGIGGEYPAGSVGCAESTGEVRSGWRHCVFILFTNSMIDIGFVFGAFVPYLVAVACHDQYLSTQWRMSLGIGAVFPLLLLILRLFVEEPKHSQQESMRHAQTPWRLVIRFYGWRLLTVSAIWFVYDFLTYPFGIYSSTILSHVLPGNAPLSTNFGWNTVIMLFYLPGTILGSKVSDLINPRWCLIIGAVLQSIIGFAMAGNYDNLAQPAMVGAFATIYGIFISLGELGQGNNIGLLAAKTCATGIRGRYYGIAAAVGKIGAFVGTYAYPYLQQAGSEGRASAQTPFYLSSGLCLVSAALAYFFLPNVSQDTIELEDMRFRAYLEEHGWDTTQLGSKKAESVEEAEKGPSATVLAPDGEAKAWWAMV